MGNDAQTQKRVLEASKLLFQRYGDDFVQWALETIDFSGLRFNFLTDQQVEIAQSLLETKNLCVSAGGGIGKSAEAALLTIWFLSCHPHAKVITTAPTGKQLNDVLWGEISFWLKRYKYKDIFESYKGRLVIKGFSEWYAVARTVSKDTRQLNDTLAGFHAPYLLIIVDEACYDEETEVLTLDGWKHYHEINNNDLVLTKNITTHATEYKKPTELHISDYEGDMYEYESKTCSFKVTPNHNMLYRIRKPRQDEYTEIRRQEIQKFDITKKSRFYMDRDVFFVGNKQDWIDIPSLGKVPTTLWASFLGWYLSEGYVNAERNTIGISQTVGVNSFHIKEILEKLNIKFGVYEKNNIEEFYINSTVLATYLAETCGSDFNNKFIPNYLKNWHKSIQTSFLESYLRGDGYSRKNGRHVIYTSSKQMADDLQEVVIKTGGYASISKRNIAGRTTWIKDHFATSSVDGFIVYISKYDNPPFISVRQNNINKVYYRGKVWCLTVPPHHSMYMRRKGQCFWGSNSGVPDPVFTALDGAMTDDRAMILLISNPVSTAGYYYDTISDPDGKGKNWGVKYFDSRKSPLVDKSFEERIIARYGKESPMYRAKVMGLPIQASDAFVITPEEYDKLVRTNREFLHGRLILSVDVGGRGEDPSIILHRSGNSLIKWDEIPTNDTVFLVQEVERLATQVYHGRDVIAIVDAVGIGAGVYDSLLYNRKVNTLAFMGSEKAFHETMYTKKRDEGYHKLHKQIKDLHFPVAPPEELKKELVNIEFDYASGLIQLKLTKKDLVKRLGHSPNFADALMMSCAVDSFAVQNKGMFVPRSASVSMATLLNKTLNPSKYGKYAKFF